MEVQRLQSTNEAWRQLLVRVYMVVFFPLAIIFSFISFFLISSLIRERDVFFLGFFMCVWIGAIAPVIHISHRAITNKKILKRVVDNIRDQKFFDPVRSFESYQEAAGKYVGIDTRNGTLLYVHKIRKGEFDVVGLSMEDWTRREGEGTTLRIFTKLVDLPCIEVNTTSAESWFNTLGAMEHKRYNTPQPFMAYVNHHIELLEYENKIHIPKLA